MRTKKNLLWQIRVVRWGAYLLDGTVRDWVGRRLRKWKRRVRKKRWERIARRQPYLDYRLSRGVRLRLYTDSVLSRQIYLGFEEVERSFVRAFLKQGDGVVDIGANIGLYTILAARLVGEQGWVWSFEPTKAVFQRLEENVRLNRLHNVTLYRMALSDQAGENALHVSLDGHDAWNSFAPPIAGEEYVLEKVPVTTLDAFVQKQALEGRIALIKMDVEGWERHVLKGGSQVLSSPLAPVLMVEFTDRAGESAGGSLQELYRLIQDLGYRLYRYDHRRRTLVPQPLQERFGYMNLIAVKNLSQVERRLRG